MEISVVVCTYNRAGQLARALAPLVLSVREARVPGEIVVVDNNSSDTTHDVVEGIARAAPVPVRYAFEARQGLSFARNRGLAEATGRIIAFTDDDCIVDPDWADAIVQEFAAHPDVAVLGGRVDLHDPADRPASTRPIDRPLRYRRAEDIYSHIIGCNLALRRAHAEAIGPFDPALGGSRGVVADDIDFVYRAFRLGAGVLYTPRPRVRHHHGRRTDDAVRRLARAYLRGRGAFLCKHVLRGDRTILRHAWWELRALVALRPAGPDRLTRSATLGALVSGAAHLVLTRLHLVAY